PEVPPVHPAPRDRQVPWLLGAPGQYDRVEFLHQPARGDAFPGVADDRLAGRLLTDEHAGAELDALGAQLLEAAVDHGFLELEVRNAVAQHAADAVALLEYGDVMAGARALLRAGAGR